MDKLPWGWMFLGSIILIALNYFFGFMAAWIPAALLVLLAALYFVPKFLKREMVTHDFDYCDVKVKTWALQKRGKHLVEPLAFQDATRMDNAPVFEILYSAVDGEMYRVEVNRRTGRVTRFVLAVSVDRDYFMSSDESKRFRHLKRKVLTPPTARERPREEVVYAPPKEERKEERKK